MSRRNVCASNTYDTLDYEQPLPFHEVRRANQKQTVKNDKMMLPNRAEIREWGTRDALTSVLMLLITRDIENFQQANME